MPSPSPALIIMIKNPIPGKTKTRLAASVGNDVALKMYGVLTNWTREQTTGLGDDVTRYLYYSDHISSDDAWPEVHFDKRLQRGDDLGARMENAFGEAFERGHDRIIIIGTDCPGMTTQYLADSFRALATCDLVVGPALDGGYTLLGMTKPNPELFREMTWSTERVLPETLKRAAELSLQVNEQAPLSDVDHLEDWHSYGWTVPS
ncbi:TIGR04282 family arsenosugar biosynthesis glycosyltransferase [Neolewinella antarctica]|uniref:Glycosyltransferase n=1 Tax=Neolewinella antarctica TaxID=442734 RepID=A0ABX0XBY5_9BACT|nr:TIGR04282 family arsenosugar biosynthesis glycosyltransferase [Neolewinella antarctica]NJC26712.1 hypothetical protein [Neolewinella antarctica]